MAIAVLRHFAACGLLWMAAAVPLSVAAQDAAPAASAPAPAARPSDVSSLDAIMAAVHGVISGPKGRQHDWDRMRSLFVPGARLIAVHTANDGATASRVMSVEDYIRAVGPFLEGEGFFEREAHRVVAAKAISPRCSAPMNRAMRCSMPSRSSAASTASS